MKIHFSDDFSKSVYYLVVRNWYAPDSLFGKVDKRKNYSFDEAQQVFQKVWDDGLHVAVENAPISSYETVKNQLSDQEQHFLRRDLEHRTVRYRDLTFIAQLLQQEEQTYEIGQLWFVHSHDKDNIILCVEFKNHEERERFHLIARQLGHRDGRILLQKYADKLLSEQ